MAPQRQEATGRRKVRRSITELIRELAKLLDETGLTEIEFERDGHARPRRPRRSGDACRGRRRRAAPAPASRSPVAGRAARDPAKHPGVVTSPMVGTAYRGAGARRASRSSRSAARSQAGETLLIIEAMKTMNQIPAPRAGTVTQILVEDGQPVEFGEPLMIIE